MGTSGGAIACGAFCFLIILPIAILVPLSLRKLDSTEYGLEYAIHAKRLDDEAKTGSLFSGPPGFQFIKFPSTQVQKDLYGTCVSKDGLPVEFSVSFQYLIPQDNMYDVVTRYRDFDKWANVVEAAGESSVHHSCSEFNISSFQNQRGVIQTTMEDNLRLKLEGDPDDENDVGVFAQAISLQLRNIGLPFEYNEAIAEKQSAEEDIALAQNQRRQETTKAQTEFLQANEQARKILDTANNEAEVILTEANLKAEEITFDFLKEAETIVDVKTSLSLTSEGVLAYLTNKLLEDASNIKIEAGEPARLSRKDEL
jgi:regulator of protease activity HflC (stomatin/prohibitin superfamily)